MPVKKVKLPSIKRKVVPTIAIIDADIFVYQAVTEACEEILNGDDEYTYRLNRKHVQDELEIRIADTMMMTGATDALLCFGSVSNWRKKILPEYKAHRAKKKPLGYLATVEWCQSTWDCDTAPFLEADDIIGLRATDPDWKPGHVKIIVSEDKDLNTIRGAHYNPRTPERGIYHVSDDEARHNHLMQALCGDTADGYKGCPGCGPVKAAQILQSAPGSMIEKWDRVVAAFKDAGLTEKDALVQTRVAHILTHGHYDWNTGELNLWTPPVVAKSLHARRARASSRS